MDIYKVEKSELYIVITMTDGSNTVGSVFLAPDSRLHDGPQTLEEHLEEAGSFLKLKDAQEEFFLAGIESTAMICLMKSEVEAAEFVKRAPVKMKICGAGDLQGELVVPESHDAFRVSDYLNTDVVWLRVETDDDIYMVRKPAVLEIYC